MLPNCRHPLVPAPLLVHPQFAYKLATSHGVAKHIMPLPHATVLHLISKGHAQPCRQTRLCLESPLHLPHCQQQQQRRQ